MKFEEVKYILDKYFEGETTDAEEIQLQNYFASSDIDERVARFKPLFSFFAQEKSLFHDETATMQRLLDKYFEGETSDAEEGQIKAYFRSERIAPQFLPFKPMFTFFEKENKISLDAPVTNKIPNRLLNSSETEQKSAKGLSVLRGGAFLRWAAAAVFILAVGYTVFQNAPSKKAGDTPIALQPTTNNNTELKETAVLSQIETVVATKTRKVKAQKRVVVEPENKAKGSENQSVAIQTETLTQAEREEALKAYEEVKAALALVSTKMKKGEDQAAENMHRMKRATDVLVR